MDLEKLNYLATNQLQFTSFETLMPGRYKIDKFFFEEGVKFNTGQRLCALIDNGNRYLMLPKRMLKTADGKPIDLVEMNKTAYDIIFEGKPSKFELKFHFALSTEEVKADDVILKPTA